ncbi:MAG: YgaP-like transmembrane domain [Chryseolinea sp.]
MKSQEEVLMINANAAILPPVSGTSQVNVGAAERIVSVATGMLLATWGIKRMKKFSALPMIISGGYLVLRGATGHCHVNTILNRNTALKKSTAVEVSGTYIINKPRQEVYAYWRRLENLPLFMKHLAEVKQINEINSFWKVYIPGGLATISWKAEIIEDQPGELLAWSSLPGSSIDNAGTVSFVDAPNHSTEINARISYRLPGGDLGSLAAQLFNPFLKNIILADLERFKYNIEGGVHYVRGDAEE